MKKSKYLEYRAVRSANRDVFLLDHRDFFETNENLHIGLGALAGGLRGKRDIDGKTYASFVPFIALMQRQLFSAFDHLASYQAYQAWVMIRPAVEIPLIMKKWIDDPACAEVWKNRQNDPKQYAAEYSGKKMRSAGLPRSDEIQRVLKVLNDNFTHPNPFYYHRHLSLTPVEFGAVSIRVEYFDEQDTIEAHVLAILHLVAVLHDSTREILMRLVSGIPSSIEHVPRIEDRFGSRACAIANSLATSKDLLCELGCWPEFK